MIYKPCLFVCMLTLEYLIWIFYFYNMKSEFKLNNHNDKMNVFNVYAEVLNIYADIYIECIC